MEERSTAGWAVDREADARILGKHAGAWPDDECGDSRVRTAERSRLAPTISTCRRDPCWVELDCSTGWWLKVKERDRAPPLSSLRRFPPLRSFTIYFTIRTRFVSDCEGRTTDLPARLCTGYHRLRLPQQLHLAAVPSTSPARSHRWIDEQAS